MAAAAACSERRAGAGQRLEVRGALCVAGTRGRPARRAVRANMQAARPGLRVLASASRRPAWPQRPRHASRVAADPPFALPFGVFVGIPNTLISYELCTAVVASAMVSVTDTVRPFLTLWSRSCALRLR